MTPNNDNSEMYLSILEEATGLSIEPQPLTEEELKNLRNFLASIELGIQQAETEYPLEDEED